MTHRSFAGTIADRYRRCGARQRWIDLVYLRSPALFVNWIVRRSRVNAPTSYRIERAIPAASPAPAFDARRELRTLIVPRGDAADRRTSLHIEMTRTTTFADVVQRLRRIEMAGRGRGREIGTTASHVTPHPARERQLDEGRPASAADMPLASSRARDVVAATAPPAAASHSALESISHATARPAMLVPDHEVERLADRVIGTIDRRIVAQRERFGRP